ncbi:zf-HC2 domain-containing protein [Geodermatophilus sabuli]|uniref:Predicted anti-sigma-YlaC factor YlaD, contains Zn-finger domain n=1 Tax=Geodermatophilus sabuli TaxID=1564158 RepID=A0A285E5M9_9ACTN|nr:zf-HC2 domain-containing protein [Geodermatophilus sabuli]MBB3082855.1 putative anti-sigma-YlaC factor YlaD [Geodermatophilus sabuli]SNX94280.1 Predicted anti-sigma-YlaC factor YlaD, contains Zn-finger domain [Geodermatophilus sabuli]
MQCTPYREALSARLDGESAALPAAELDEHLAGCAGCAGWARQAELVTRRARLAPAPPVPDLTAAVLAALPRELPGAVAAARARLAATALRLALLAVGVAQAAFAWPSLTTGTAAMSAPVHVAHETGAWNLGVAAAFLAVAAAPRLAAGALPFLGTFAALLTALTVADLRAGHVHADRAVVHLLVLVGVALVATVAWRGRRRRPVPAVARERVPA